MSTEIARPQLRIGPRSANPWVIRRAIARKLLTQPEAVTRDEATAFLDAIRSEFSATVARRSLHVVDAAEGAR